MEHQLPPTPPQQQSRSSLGEITSSSNEEKAIHPTSARSNFSMPSTVETVNTASSTSSVAKASSTVITPTASTRRLGNRSSGIIASFRPLGNNDNTNDNGHRSLSQSLSSRPPSALTPSTTGSSGNISQLYVVKHKHQQQQQQQYGSVNEGESPSERQRRQNLKHSVSEPLEDTFDDSGYDYTIDIPDEDEDNELEQDADSDIEESWRPAAQERRGWIDDDKHDDVGVVPKTPSRPEIDTFLDALVFDSRKDGRLPSVNAPSSAGAQSVRSTGSGDRRRKRLARRNMSAGVGDTSLVSSLRPSLQSSGASSTDGGTVLSSLDSLGTYSMSASLSRASEGSPFTKTSNQSSDSSRQALSAPIAWKRKGKRPTRAYSSPTIDEDSASQKMSASFASFGRQRRHKSDSYPIGSNNNNTYGGISAHHESFNNSIENFPSPGMLNTFLDLQSSRHSRPHSAHTVCGNNPSREKVSIVMSTPNEEGGLSTFQVGSKEAMIIESLLRTSKESSPTRKREAMLDWLESTAAEILSPTQHDAILDSERIGNRSGGMADIIPPFQPSADSPQQSPEESTRVSERYMERSPEESIGILDKEEGVHQQSQYNQPGERLVNGLEEENVLLNSERTSNRPLTRANSSSVGRPSRQAVRDTQNQQLRKVRSSSGPRRGRRHLRTMDSAGLDELDGSSSKGRRDDRRMLMQKYHSVPALSNHENESSPVSEVVSQSPRKQISGTEGLVKRQGSNSEKEKELSTQQTNQEEEMDFEELNKSFLDKFLDHDVEAQDSASQLITSPGGTPKKKKFDVQQYKAGLTDVPVQDSESKPRTAPKLRLASMKKMKSVPALGSRTDGLVAPIKSPKKKTKKTGKTKKGSSKKKEKKMSKDDDIEKSANALKSEMVHEKLTLQDLPRQSATKIESTDRWEMSCKLKKSKSLSNLDRRAYDIDDRQLLVQRLKALSNAQDQPDHDCKMASKGSASKLKSPGTKSKKKKLTDSSKGLQSFKSLRNLEASRPAGFQMEGRWSSVPGGLGILNDDECVKFESMASPTSKKKKKSSKSRESKSAIADEDDEIIDIVSPPLKPMRKNSRRPGEKMKDLKRIARSTPNLGSADRVGIRVSHGHSIAEGSILEVPDDSTVCSELTDVYSVDLTEASSASPRKKKKNDKSKLKAISESATSWGELSLSDSMTKDKRVHLKKRWDTPNQGADGLDGLKSPLRVTDEIPDKEKKKFAWLKNKLPFMKKS